MRVRAMPARTGECGQVNAPYVDFEIDSPRTRGRQVRAARFRRGRRCDPRADETAPARLCGLGLALEACLLGVDGEITDSATGAAVQGRPAEALAPAANSLAVRGIASEPGWIELTGGLTDAVFVEPGREISAEFTHLGALRVVGA
jgi:2-oxo-3-hexenedioate decarboxylase